MDLKNVPTAAWVCVTAVVISALASLVVLQLNGSDSSEVRWLILTLLNAGGLVAGVGSTVYAGAAARTSQQTAQQTNGQLDVRIESAVQRAMTKRGAGDKMSLSEATGNTATSGAGTNAGLPPYSAGEQQ